VEIIMQATEKMDSQGKSKWALPFFTIWTGQAFSIFGSQLVHFALIWWLTVKTGSGTVLAMATIVGILPQILLGPVAGALVDRGNRRVIMMLADALVAVATAVLAVLFIFEAVQTWQVYLVLFVRAVAGSFHWPAMAASTSLMVPRQHLSRVQGANQTLNGGLSIITAPLAALLLDRFSMQVILGIDIATALLAILPLFFIAIPQPPATTSPAERLAAKPSVWSDMRAGFRYVGKWPSLLLILIMATLINLVLTPAFTLLPLLIKGEFGGGAMQLAWVESAGGIGIILGGLLLGIWGGFKRRILTTLVGLVGLGIGTLIIGITPAALLFLVVGAMFLVGFMQPITNGPLLAVLQAVVAPEMQGRVFTLVGSLAAAMSPLGLVIAGPLSDAVGVRAWFIAGGILTGCMGVAGFMIPAILHVEDHRAPAMEDEAATAVLPPVTLPEAECD
jgi:DHA3 family macrolide efflux protein-like MFS transporter